VLGSNRKTILYPREEKKSVGRPCPCLRTVKVLTSHPCQNIQSGIVLSGFTAYILYVFLIYPHVWYMSAPLNHSDRTAEDPLCGSINTRIVLKVFFYDHWN
jgi:hypothetical protein